MRPSRRGSWLDLVINISVLVFLGYALLRPAGPLGRKWNARRAEQHLIAVAVEKWDRLAAGSSSGLPVVVEFIDYECPFCRQAHLLLDDAAEGGGVEIVYRQMPLVIHPRADGAARAALCAEAQGRFREMHDLLLETEDWRSSAHPWTDLAVYAGVEDSERFQACLSSEWVLGRLKADRRLADALGVSATPTFVGLGGSHHGRPLLSDLQRIAGSERHE